LILDGASKAQGSFYSLTDAQKETVVALNGEQVILKGYVISISGGRYINVVMTSLEKK
jgi:hypothetical protein